MNVIERALSIALVAHKGQVDRGGAPYILHPMKVASEQKSEAAIVAALLHDVVEDSDWSLLDLEAEGFSEEVLDAVALLSHAPGEDYFDYVRKIGRNEIAKSVKKADLRHNSDLSRLSKVSEKDLARVEKYKKALEILGE